jgi:hypothetical protein
MKKFFSIIALIAIIGVLAGVGLGSAADLPLAGGTIQGGNDNDVQTQENHVYVAGWQLEQGEIGDNVAVTGLVYGVRLWGFDLDTVGLEVYVNITKNGVVISQQAGAEVVPADGAVPADNQPAANKIGIVVALDPPVYAQDITDIEVFLEGPNND